MKYLAAACSALALFASAACADEFSLHGVRLGMPAQEAALLLEEACPGKCMSYRAGGPGGIGEQTVYLRYQTIYFSNTRQVEVDRSKPYESVSYTLGPDRTVIAVLGRVFGSATRADEYFEKMAAAYRGPLQAFTEQKKLLVTAKGDLSTDHLFRFYEPALQGRKFTVSKLADQYGATAVAHHVDFDAVRAIERSQPEQFAEIRRSLGIGVKQDGSPQLEPRETSSLEARNAQQLTPIRGAFVSQLSEGAERIEVIAEDAQSPSRILLNGQQVAQASFAEDGLTYEGLRSLGGGLFEISVSQSGNGCYAQGHTVLRVQDGQGYLSESFGRCDGFIARNGATHYFVYASTESEPEWVLALP